MQYFQFANELKKADNMKDKQAVVESYLADKVPSVNPFLFWTDSYKLSHIFFETPNTKEIYSNASVRFAHYLQDLLGEYFSNEYIAFGMQWMMLRFHMMAKTGFFDRPKDEVLNEMRDTLLPYIGMENFEHFSALHDLGYIPLHVKALEEGTVAPVGLPWFTVHNTHPEFRWLANYLESGMSTDSWKQLTVATVAYAFRKISERFAMETQGNLDGVEWQNHDFSTRGQSGFESGAINGVAFLTGSKGTDNLPAMWAARDFYFASDASKIAGSVPAGEHSVTTLGILTEQRRAAEKGEEIDLNEAERRYTRWIMTQRFPTGIVSFVADSFDYWNFVENIVPSLYSEVMARDGKFVVRGDSGNPIHVIAGYRIYDADTDKRVIGRFQSFAHMKLNTQIWWKSDIEVVKFKGVYYRLNTDSMGTINEDVISGTEAIGTIESLWNSFGGTENALGYKHLDSHIGMIYGDGITVHRADEILTRLKNKGFASTNIVFGVGSYSLNMLSRDHLGIAIKATNAVVTIGDTDVDAPIYKEPKTDMSKKSDRGYLVVLEDVDGHLYKKDMASREEMLHIGLLDTLYMNGQFHSFTDLEKVRAKIRSGEGK